MSPLVLGAGNNVNREAYSSFLVADDFFDTNGVSLPNHAPDKAPVGAVWSEEQGSAWDINGNKVDGGGADSDLVAIEAGSPNVLVQAVVNGKGNNGPGLLVRYLDTTHHWLLQVNFVANLLQLYEIDGGGYVQRTNPSTGAIDNATDYVVGLQVGDDDEFHLILDGVDLAQYTSSLHNTRTQVGFRQAAAVYDRFRVSAV